VKHIRIRESKRNTKKHTYKMSHKRVKLNFEYLTLDEDCLYTPASFAQFNKYLQDKKFRALYIKVLEDLGLGMERKLKYVSKELFPNLRIAIFKKENNYSFKLDEFVALMYLFYFRKIDFDFSDLDLDNMYSSLISDEDTYNPLNS